MSDVRFLVHEIWGGSSVLRAFLNLRLSREVLHGDVIDIGGGKDATYLAFMRRDADGNFTTLDAKAGSTVDFERDRLPINDRAYDTVLFLNVMEHVYNHRHILCEVYRIKKPSGKLIGFVPFLMWYHPDPRDFFRYTEDALRVIFDEMLPQPGLGTIEPVSHGPCITASHMVLLTMPRLLRVPLFIAAYYLDLLVMRVRPRVRGRYALGYYFEL